MTWQDMESDRKRNAYDVATRASIERAVQETIKFLKLPHRTARSEQRSRRQAIAITSNALANVIAEDVANGQPPWPQTVDKFRLCREMMEDPIPAPEPEFTGCVHCLGLDAHEPDCVYGNGA